ncbi:MAG: hypothetical protein QG556_227 [Pseudomonadota bacterium]|nr:hypothetical protein [Pseudomonadota bacterium]
MKKIQAYFLLESLLISLLWMSLLGGLIYLFDFQQRIQFQLERQAFQYRQLMGFESLFSKWMTNFSSLACLYPLQKYDNTLYLHDLPIWIESMNTVQFYTGHLQLVTNAQPHPEKSLTITQDGRDIKTPPYWLFVYEKQLLKFKNDKIYLEHDGHTQMLLEGLKGIQIRMDDGFVELRVQSPYFLKRYRLCQNFKTDFL